MSLESSFLIGQIPFHRVSKLWSLIVEDSNTITTLNQNKACIVVRAITPSIEETPR